MVFGLKDIFMRGVWLCEIRAKLKGWKGHLQVGSKIHIHRHSVLDRYMGGNLILGNNVNINRYCKISTCGGDIIIGNNVNMGEYITITAQGGVIVEDDVLFADHISIIANEHVYESICEPIWKQGCKSRGIHIGAGTWIGINVTILSGSYIGKNSVIGAGSVVKGVFPDYCVIAGNPARVIKRYNANTGVWDNKKHYVI